MHFVFPVSYKMNSKLLFSNDHMISMFFRIHARVLSQDLETKCLNFSKH